ncbi:hypothetical protein GCM10029964_009260 [Kibdelosporangium lantanae]
MLGGVGEVVRDLEAQLTGRHDHQDLRGAVARGGDPVQQRDAEPEGLARTGARLADDVVAGHGQRQGQLLDRERALDAGRGERPGDLLADAELGERR